MLTADRAERAVPSAVPRRAELDPRRQAPTDTAMRITKQEVIDATGLAAVEQLSELSMANKYVHEVGFVAKMPALRELNLAFNELASVEDLCKNAALEQLNVSHNALRSLGGLEALARLTTLRASHNRLRDVRDLAQCFALEECWLQSNRLIDLEAVVESLRALPRLHCLVLLGNPVCERAEYRMVRIKHDDFCIKTDDLCI